MALFSRKNLNKLEGHKWMIEDDIEDVLLKFSKKCKTQIAIFYIVLDEGEVKDIDDLYRLPVATRLYGIGLMASPLSTYPNYDYCTETNKNLLRNMLKDEKYYNRIYLNDLENMNVKPY